MASAFGGVGLFVVLAVAFWFASRGLADLLVFAAFVGAIVCVAGAASVGITDFACWTCAIARASGGLADRLGFALGFVAIVGGTIAACAVGADLIARTCGAIGANALTDGFVFAASFGAIVGCARRFFALADDDGGVVDGSTAVFLVDDGLLFIIGELSITVAVGPYSDAFFDGAIIDIFVFTACCGVKLKDELHSAFKGEFAVVRAIIEDFALDVSVDAVAFGVVAVGGRAAQKRRRAGNLSVHRPFSEHHRGDRTRDRLWPRDRACRRSGYP